MRHWLGRLSFSFIIIGAVLLWESYKILSGRMIGVPAWRVGLYLAGAVCALVVGALGIRQRHRP
jgi:predicted membrane protein